MTHAQISVQQANEGVLKRSLYKYLRAETTDNEIHAIRDYSGGVGFRYTASEGAVRIARILIVIKDNGIIGVSSYGAMSALTNGIRLLIRNSDETEKVDLLDTITIKQNMQWQCPFFDVNINDKGAGNDGYIAARGSFWKAGQLLRLAQGEIFEAFLQDDFSDLIDHTFMIQGLFE